MRQVVCCKARWTNVAEIECSRGSRSGHRTDYSLIMMAGLCVRYAAVHPEPCSFSHPNISSCIHAGAGVRNTRRPAVRCLLRWQYLSTEGVRVYNATLHCWCCWRNHFGADAKHYYPVGFTWVADLSDRSKHHHRPLEHSSLQNTPTTSGRAIERAWLRCYESTRPLPPLYPSLAAVPVLKAKHTDMFQLSKREYLPFYGP